MKRCVNLDWLEIFCEEDINSPRNVDYFRERGYTVIPRSYGTPIYKEMFTIYIEDFPFIEVRRNPYSLKQNGGIFKQNACHLRLSNRECYDRNPIQNLMQFIEVHGYKFKSISRVDICCDFCKFDNNVNPASMISSYMKGYVSKINLSNLSAYGKDKFYSREFNSVSWGSKPIKVKIYDKTLELKEKKDKFYIRDSWEDAGLNQSTKIWRVEFSLTSDIKIFVNEDADKFVLNELKTFDNRNKLIFLFLSLAKKYFHFKKVELTREGKHKRKDRCKDIPYFFEHLKENAFIPRKLCTDKEPTRTQKMLVSELAKLRDNENTPAEAKKSANIVLAYMIYSNRMNNRENLIE